jgi:DNA-directed RNA polymerase subunit M/transcription elongation factor TFIIS
MYYISLKQEDSNDLIYYCRNCGHNDDKLINNNLCISKNEYSKKDSKFNNIINKYTKLDPTLPRINTIKCPNNDCISNKNLNENPREVIYLRYDDINMKYIYLCCNCDYSWTTNN